MPRTRGGGHIRIQAWMCDKCSRLQPGETKPVGWYETTIVHIGTNTETALLCSARCTTRYFRDLEPKPNPATKEAATDPPADGRCDLCQWEPKPGGTNPAISLRMHRYKRHGASYA